MRAIGYDRVIGPPALCQFEGCGRAIHHDDLGRGESFETLDSDVTQTPGSQHGHFSAWIEDVRGFFDGMVGGQTRISQSGNVFGMKAGIQLDD